MIAPVSWSWRRMLYLVNARYITVSSSPSVASHPIVVGDAGFLSEETTLEKDDYERVDFYKLHLNEILKGKKTSFCHNHQIYTSLMARKCKINII